MRTVTSLLPHSLSWLALLAIGASGQNVSFPGAKSQSLSPDGRYVVQNINDEHKNPAHSLALRDSRSGKEKQFYLYSRSVDVLWSPLSNALVINNHGGSDFSKPVLFKLPLSGGGIDLWTKLIAFLGSRAEARSALKNHHVYFTASRWLNGSELACKLSGYGEADPRGFTRYYVYEIDKGFRGLQSPNHH